MKDIDNVISKINKLPPMPEVVSKILRLAGDPSVAAKSIIDVIKYDQNITANVLRLCNSSYYSLNRKIKSLNEAVVFLGNKVVYNMIVTSFSVNLLGRENKGYFLEKGKLWEHSVSSAILAKEISKKVAFEDEHMAYSTALMHDTGKVVLDKFVFDEYDAIIKRVQEQKTEFREIEEEVIGIDHAQVGAMLAENWKFPDEIITAIRYHHNPENAPSYKKLTYIVHLADMLSIMFGFGSGIDGLAYRFSDTVLDELELKEKEIYSLCPFLINEIKKANDILKI